jgi:integrase
MKLTFYQRGNMIQLRASKGSEMVRLSTGIKAPPDLKFLPTKEQFQGNTPRVKQLNDEIHYQRTRVMDLARQYNGDLQAIKAAVGKKAPEVETEEVVYDLVPLLKKYVSMIRSGEIKTKKKTPFKAKSVKLYNYAANLYEQFTKDEGINLKECDLSGKELLDKRRISTLFTGHFNSFGEWMIEQELSVNSRADIMALIRAMIKYWEQYLFLHLPKIEVIASFQTAIICLPEDFLQSFVMDTHKKYEGFGDYDKFVWEVCAIMLVTTLRVSDAIALTKSNFTEINGELFLAKENQKTGADTLIPIPKVLARRMQANIAQFGDIWNKKGKVGVDNFRTKMERFFEQYPEMHQEVSFKDVDVHGKTFMNTKKLYEIVHPHMFRKSAITTMLANGVSEEHVKFASGHTANSGSFARYKGWVDRAYNSEIKGYQNRMFGE